MFRRTIGKNPPGNPAINQDLDFGASTTPQEIVGGFSPRRTGGGEPQ
jgi:hypothetical protein